jgi:hypothetical protein
MFGGSSHLQPDHLRKSKPLRNPDVLQELGKDGSVLLLAPLLQQGNGFVGMMAKWVKAPDHKTFELEPVGAFVWSLCDGQHTFEGISKRLKEQFKMNRIEADAALLAFLQMLGQRSLITLTVGKEK